MNADEIEVAVSELVSQPFDLADFPNQFFDIFGDKETSPAEKNTYSVSGVQNR